MKRVMAMVAFSLVLATGTAAQAGNHVGLGRWFGLGWGPGYHSRGTTDGYGYGAVQYDGPEQIPTPEAVNTSRLTPTPRVPAVDGTPYSVGGSSTQSVLRPRSEAHRPTYGFPQPAQ